MIEILYENNKAKVIKLQKCYSSLNINITEHDIIHENKIKNKLKSIFNFNSKETALIIKDVDHVIINSIGKNIKLLKMEKITSYEIDDLKIVI